MGNSLCKYLSQDQLSKLYKLLNKSNVDVKWQISKGKEELAACGMFNDIV